MAAPEDVSIGVKLCLRGEEEEWGVFDKCVVCLSGEEENGELEPLSRSCDEGIEEDFSVSSFVAKTPFD